MYTVAATGPVADADRTSIGAADPCVMTSPSAAEVLALTAKPAPANEAVRFATVMAFVDGKFDEVKLKAVLADRDDAHADRIYRLVQTRVPIRDL